MRTHPLYVVVGQRRVDGALAQARADDRLDDGAEQDTVYPRAGHSGAPHRTRSSALCGRTVAARLPLVL